MQVREKCSIKLELEIIQTHYSTVEGGSPFKVREPRTATLPVFAHQFNEDAICSGGLSAVCSGHIHLVLHHFGFGGTEKPVWRIKSDGSHNYYSHYIKRLHFEKGNHVTVQLRPSAADYALLSLC